MHSKDTPTATQLIQRPPDHLARIRTPGAPSGKRNAANILRSAHFPGRVRQAFTLVELLVVVGIIAILVSILLPALEQARDAAHMIKCAANLRSIGQGLMAYAAENNQYLPTSYDYRGSTVAPDPGNPTGPNVQQPTTPVYGYVHWSSYLFGSTPPDAFRCPAIHDGGLPASDPPSGVNNFDTNQVKESANVGTGYTGGQVSAISAIDGTGANTGPYYPDAQPVRMAYTLNEALCGRNKYVLGFQGCTQTYRNVSLGTISNGSGTILATEFIDEWGIVSGAYDGGGGGGSGGDGVVCKSHRPVQPFRANGSAAGDTAASSVCDLSTLTPTTKLRKTNATDFYNLTPGTIAGQPSIDPITDYKQTNANGQMYSAATRATRLDWVGRNHGINQFYTENKTNFLYADGHVETKSVLQTVPPNNQVGLPWEWGDVPYSLSNGRTVPLQTP